MRTRSNSAPLALPGLAPVIAVVALILYAVSGHGHTSTVVTRIAGTPSGSGLNAAAIFANAHPGVVDITARSWQSSDSGTGMVLDARGDVLTADLVVAGADSISVAFQGGATR